MSLPHSGAPKVPNPLPRSVLAGSACSALTPRQVSETLGKAVKGVSDDVPGLGAECDWGNRESGSGLTVTFITETHQGLSAVYANTKPASRVWRPLPPIQGFPAVGHSVTRTDTCDVSVGLADDLSVDVAGTLGDSKRGKVDPCDIVPQTANLVVTTLRRKAGS